MRDQKARLSDIRAAIRDLQTFVRGLSEGEFLKLPETDQKTYRAIKNALSEIGEAIKELPPAIFEAHPGIDWRGFAALRDVIAHQYFQLKLHRLWPTLADEVPNLLTAIEAELAKSPGEKS